MKSISARMAYAIESADIELINASLLGIISLLITIKFNCEATSRTGS